MEQKKTGRRVLRAALGTLGLALFVYLVRDSGVTGAMLVTFGIGPFALLCLAFAPVAILDTVAWYFGVRHVARPGFMRLLGLRVAGDAMTSGLPGGVVLGETYKGMMLSRWYGISGPDTTTSLLFVRFGLGLSQVFFILIGLMLCRSILAQRSVALFGFAGADWIALALTVGMGALVWLPLGLMFKGVTFRGVARWLARFPVARLRRWLEARDDKIRELDESGVRMLQDNRSNVLAAMLFLLLGWFVTAIESYLLLHFLGIKADWRMAYVIESVGSMFRLIFFMVPAGIGGQDASFVALFKLYGLSPTAAGLFVLIKRIKEVVWIGGGFVLVPILGRLGRPR